MSDADVEVELSCCVARTWALQLLIRLTLKWRWTVVLLGPGRCNCFWVWYCIRFGTRLLCMYVNICCTYTSRCERRIINIGWVPCFDIRVESFPRMTSRMACHEYSVYDVESAFELINCWNLWFNWLIERWFFLDRLLGGSSEYFATSYLPSPSCRFSTLNPPGRRLPGYWRRSG